MARIDGTNGNDSRFGTDNADTFYLKDGDDYAQGYGGADLMYGSDGNDTLYGQGGADTLFGGNGHDQLIGGAGADVLVGGSGADAMYGDGGADRFRFDKIDPNASNSIADFSRAQNDVIDLSNIDANRNVAGDQAFRFLATQEFTGRAGEVRFEWSSFLDRVVVQLDVDGDRSADMSFLVGGDRYLYNSDFIL